MTDKEDIVDLDSPSWFYNRRGSDWRLKVILANEMEAFGLRLQNNPAFVLLYNMQSFLSRRIPQKFRTSFDNALTWLRSKTLQLKGVKYIISQGRRPPVEAKKPILWETYFLPPQRGEMRSPKEFCRGGADPWIRAIDRFGGNVKLIAVRGRYSMSCLMKMYPEYADKIVNLGFVQREYNIIPVKEIEKKQTESNLTILFVGREAIRKGLPQLISALSRLREEGITNFHLLVVSSFVDGKIDIPLVDWIEQHCEIVHEELLTIFRRAQIFAMPSKYESYGLVYLEALANGCVTIARNEEPQRELMNYGEAGVLVDAYSVEDITNHLRTVLLDREERVRLACNAVTYYTEHLSQRVVRQNWTDALSRLRS